MYRVDDEPIAELIGRWRIALAAAHKAHLSLARRLTRQDRQLGLIVVILTSASGTTAFATLNRASFVVQMTAF
jgi:hypothetical protein